MRIEESRVFGVRQQGCQSAGKGAGHGLPWSRARHSEAAKPPRQSQVCAGLEVATAGPAGLAMTRRGHNPIALADLRREKREGRSQNAEVKGQGAGRGRL